jgi:hypothetical protein
MSLGVALVRFRGEIMAGNISKNARREGAQELVSRWGGKIIMKSVFENGKMRHFAVCEKTGNQARKPKDLM